MDVVAEGDAVAQEHDAADALGLLDGVVTIAVSVGVELLLGRAPGGNPPAPLEQIRRRRLALGRVRVLPEPAGPFQQGQREGGDPDGQGEVDRVLGKRARA
jgi:hypothetical protein